jgi:hypothetical protein
MIDYSRARRAQWETKGEGLTGEDRKRAFRQYLARPSAVKMEELQEWRRRKKHSSEGRQGSKSSDALTSAFSTHLTPISTQ